MDCIFIVPKEQLPKMVLQQLLQLLPGRRKPGVLCRASSLFGDPLDHDLLGQRQEDGALLLDLGEVHAPGLVERHECAEGGAWPADPCLVGVVGVHERKQESSVSATTHVLPVLPPDLDRAPSLALSLHSSPRAELALAAPVVDDGLVQALQPRGDGMGAAADSGLEGAVGAGQVQLLGEGLGEAASAPLGGAVCTSTARERPASSRRDGACRRGTRTAPSATALRAGWRCTKATSTRCEWRLEPSLRACL